MRDSAEPERAQLHGIEGSYCNPIRAHSGDGEMDRQVPPRQCGTATRGGPSSTVRWALHDAARRVFMGACWGALILCVFVVLFVLTAVVVHWVLPESPAGLQYSLLAVQAGIAAAITGVMIYVSTRRKERRLSAATRRLSQLLEAYQENPSAHERFNNPRLVHCREVLKCTQTECPMCDLPGERCWQLMALSRAEGDLHSRSVEIKECHNCVVYQRSCPDGLTEMGESFNNLMFLLEQDAQRLVRMRAQMVEKEKMVAIGQMAAGVAHEVGNPLSSISSIVQMLRRARSVEQGMAQVDIADQLDLIETNVQRIAGITRQLTRVARPAPDRWERVSVEEILEEVVDLIRLDERARRIEITFEPPRSRLSTYALCEQLQQVFINIALNALDAMPERGSLTIRGEEKHREIVVTLKDTGCGIAPDTGRRVFEPFFTTKEPGQGTGLGLPVSYSIVRKHGGTIDFDTGAEPGTVFTVTLPILDRPPDEEQETNGRASGDK